MNHFRYLKSRLHCEDVSVDDVVRETGTPVYIYSSTTMARHFEVFRSAFDDIPHVVCYSVKANSNIAIIRLFASMGSGVDIVSGGELYRSLKGGVDPSKIVYSGVGKKEWEIEMALERGILMFNVESWDELETIQRIAGRKGKTAPVAIRVNPDVDPRTHPYISTGMKENKFGIDINESVKLYKKAKRLKNIALKGVDCHIGSQLTEVKPFVDALGIVSDFVRRLRKEGIGVEYIDIGGGLGITYHDETPPHPIEYASAVASIVRKLDVTLILEPGRVLTGNSGILVTELLYTKETGRKTFYIVDAAMNDLFRPSLYGSYHKIIPLRRRRRKMVEVDVVGPVCESGDFLAKDRKIEGMKKGDRLAVLSTGAYGFAMSSNYNSRGRVPEVLVRGDRFYVIRERETMKDLIRGEKFPPFLRKKG